jgi:hypothetical protein
MRRIWRAVFCVLGTSGLIIGMVSASPGLVSAATVIPAHGPMHRSQNCTGTVSAPGTLAGTYDNLVITGACVVDAGPVSVRGNLRIAPGGALTAIWGLDDQTGTGNSNLTVHGNLVVENQGSLMLGCYSLVLPLWTGAGTLADIPDFPCADDPNPNAPTLNTHDVVDGNLISDNPIGTVTHNNVIHGNVVERGGGAGLGCAPVGIFNQYFGLPDYSDYSNDIIGGNLIVKDLSTCWMGMMRNVVHGNMVVSHDLGTPDANEIVTNTVYGNLICRGNNPQMEFGDSNGKPNMVAGRATGECGFNVILPNPGPDSGVPCPPCTVIMQPASVKLHRARH